VVTARRFAIAIDRQGDIFTSEVNTGQRVQKFRRLDMQN
jgi:hypothetical protein